MMDVEFILRLCEREPHSVPGELDKLRQAAARTLAQVRTTMFELRPVILETQGLQAALESYVERLASTEQMDVRLEIRNLAARLPPRVERLCFVIIQEAVGNVKKHAHAAVTRIIVERRPRDLIIAVRDDGTGFDVARAQQEYDRRGNLGLLNIQERAEMLGARYAIHSAPGRGTLVSLAVPLEGRRAPVPGTATTRTEPADELGADRSLHEVDRPARSNGAPVGPARRRKGTGPLGLLSQGESAGDGA
jgi:signal transduction histidine kinase